MITLEALEKVVEDKIDAWQHDWSIDVPLHQYLGWEYSDYVRWVETGELPMIDFVSVEDHTPLS